MEINQVKRKKKKKTNKFNYIIEKIAVATS